MTSRYLTYGIQFVNSMFIAIALGPEYLAGWGFINLILQYVAQFNFGVPYSLNVLLSINKSNQKKIESLLSTSLFLYAILSVLIVVISAVLHSMGVDIGGKYAFDKYAYVVLLIAIVTHFNSLFTNYYRILNRLWEIVFFQSIIPISMLIAFFFAKGEQLLQLILWIMFTGQVFALLLYLKNSHIRIFKPMLALTKPLLGKGFYLFIYNACFYLILLSTRTVVSAGYEVEEFGYFTFSFTLANIIMLLFDSFSFLIYPKTINRFNRAGNMESIHILEMIRVNYITSVHLVMYLFLIGFPIVIKLFPQYDSVFKCFALMAMTVALYSNCFAFSSFLTAHGKEKILGVLAFTALVINIILALFISQTLKMAYEYVILATMISYVIYNILLSFYSFRIMGFSCSFINIMTENFMPRLFIPFVVSLGLIILEAQWYGYLSLLFLFLFLNRKHLNSIRNTIGRIMNNPTIINI